jgi:chemotaxis protein histidine kinase CheA
MEQVQLIFKSGLSTALEADIISGRGQGLAIAWEKVRAEGGELTVECKAGVGTRFTIVMPEPLPEGSHPETLAKGLSVTT